MAAKNTNKSIYQHLGKLFAAVLKYYISTLLRLKKIDTLTLKLSNSTLHLSLYLSYELQYTYICFAAILAAILKNYILKLLPLQGNASLTLILSKSTPQLSLYLNYELRYTCFSVLTAILVAILDSHTSKSLPL